MYIPCIFHEILHHGWAHLLRRLPHLAQLRAAQAAVDEGDGVHMRQPEVAGSGNLPGISHEKISCQWENPWEMSALPQYPMKSIPGNVSHWIIGNDGVLQSLHVWRFEWKSPRRLDTVAIFGRPRG